MPYYYFYYITPLLRTISLFDARFLRIIWEINWDFPTLICLCASSFYRCLRASYQCIMGVRGLISELQKYLPYFLDKILENSFLLSIRTTMSEACQIIGKVALEKPTHCLSNW